MFRKENDQYIWKLYPQHYRKSSRKRQWPLKPNKSKRQKRSLALPALAATSPGRGKAEEASAWLCMKSWSCSLCSRIPHHRLFSPHLALRLAAPTALSRTRTHHPSCDDLFWVTDALLQPDRKLRTESEKQLGRAVYMGRTVIKTPSKKNQVIFQKLCYFLLALCHSNIAVCLFIYYFITS